MERDFEVVEFGGLRIIKCPGASAQSVSNADFYMTRERYGESWSDYATQVPRFRPAYPSPAEFGDESLDQVLSVAWPNGIPEDIAALLSGSRVAVFDGHGNSYEGIGWGAHIEDDYVISIQELVDVYLAGYDVLMFAVCNPEKETINSPNRVVIYPLGNFSVSGEFQLLVAGNR